MGVGPMYEEPLPPSEGTDSENVRQSDTPKKQHVEITKLEKNNTSDGRTHFDSAALQQENIVLNKELRGLLRENGDLRVDIERKKARITELERELARVLKSEETSPVASAG